LTGFCKNGEDLYLSFPTRKSKQKYPAYTIERERLDWEFFSPKTNNIYCVTKRTHYATVSCYSVADATRKIKLLCEFSCFLIKKIVMDSAGMFRKEIGYIKNIFVHIYKRIQDIVDGSLPGLTERLSSEGLYMLSASAYETHYAVYELFGCINSSEIASKLDKREGKLYQVEGKLNQVEGKLDQVEGKLDQVEGKLDQVEGKLDQVEGKLDQVEGKFDKVEGKFEKVEGKFEKIDVYFLAIGGSEKLEGDNENFWDKRNRQSGQPPLLFCSPFKKSVRDTKININQCLTKIECLWERIKNKIENHLKWFLVAGTVKKPEELIHILLNIKKGVHYVKC
jgi:uncharacterized protein YjbJ (UPF0337 family)